MFKSLDSQMKLLYDEPDVLSLVIVFLDPQPWGRDISDFVFGLRPSLNSRIYEKEIGSNRPLKNSGGESDSWPRLVLIVNSKSWRNPSAPYAT